MIRPTLENIQQDFFDFIIIDECHRGGANDESSWRSHYGIFQSSRSIRFDSYTKANQTTQTHTITLVSQFMCIR
jgi:type I restriction enzyme, R subunit